MIRSAACVLAAAVAAPAFAQVTLNASINVDNQFTAFISTSPILAGTEFLTGNSWPTTYSGNFVFPAGGTYYLHVLATDVGRPEMFIGTFSLANAAGSTFANGTTDLLTSPTDWVVSNTGFGAATTPAMDLGGNGAGPWGNFASQSPAARFLWAPNYTSTVYFTAV
ncbi:MAG TPA: hypothetical protein VEB22_06545, partial [Phycisphaerales bacterium]|nr:hypothetical protein [Phycisphaerales bacterium]